MWWRGCLFWTAQDMHDWCVERAEPRRWSRCLNRLLGEQHALGVGSLMSLLQRGAQCWASCKRSKRLLQQLGREAYHVLERQRIAGRLRPHPDLL